MPSSTTWRDSVVPVGATITGAILGRRAINRAQNRLTGGVTRASDLITQGNKDAMDVYKDTYGQQRETLNPFITAGQTALSNMKPVQPFKFDASDLSNDPGYQFLQSEGQKTLRREGNADLNRFSGATIKAMLQRNQNLADTHFNEVYGRQENTFRGNQAAEENRMNNMINTGLTASGEQVTAAGNYGRNVATTQKATSEQLASLEQQRADAQAEGDIAKANGISNAISQGLDIVGADKILKTLGLKGGPGPQAPAGTPWQSLMPEALGDNAGAGAAAAGGAAASTAAGITGATVGGAVAAPALTGSSLAAVAGGAVPELASLPAVGMAPTFAAAPAAVAPGGGMAASLGAFFSNPITIAAGAAIAGAIIWKKSQAHPTATTFVNKFQKPFGEHLGKIVDGFDQALASGRLDKATAEQMYQQTANFVDQFEKDRKAFAAKGSKERKVAEQAKATMTSWAGPNFENVLGKMRAAINSLPEAA